MWRSDGDGKPMIPDGDPEPLPLRPLWGNVSVNPSKANQEKEFMRAKECLEKQRVIKQGVAKYIKVWKSMMRRDALYAQEMSGYVAYWEHLYSEITGPLPRNQDVLQEGFWPITDWQQDHAASSQASTSTSGIPGMTPEDDLESFPFYGPAKERPRPNFNPFRDVLLGDFVLCRPSHKHHLPVWLNQALTCVDLREGPNYRTFTMEWWTSMKGSKKEGKRAVARECWTRRWSPELTLPQRISCTSVLFSHRVPSHRAKGPPKTHLIPEASVTMAMANLAAHGVGVDDDDEVED
jgi:hypothetical protein